MQSLLQSLYDAVILPILSQGYGIILGAFIGYLVCANKMQKELLTRAKEISKLNYNFNTLGAKILSIFKLRIAAQNYSLDLEKVSTSQAMLLFERLESQLLNVGLKEEAKTVREEQEQFVAQHNITTMQLNRDFMEVSSAHKDLANFLIKECNVPPDDGITKSDEDSHSMSGPEGKGPVVSLVKNF